MACICESVFLREAIIFVYINRAYKLTTEHIIAAPTVFIYILKGIYVALIFSSSHMLMLLKNSPSKSAITGRLVTGIDFIIKKKETFSDVYSTLMTI